jgi:hypothetical protein
LAELAYGYHVVVKREGASAEQRSCTTARITASWEERNSVITPQAPLSRQCSIAAKNNSVVDRQT